MDNKRCDVTSLKHFNISIFKHKKCGKPISIKVDLLFFGKVNIAVAIDSGYKLLLEKHNNPLQKKREILYKIINCRKLFGENKFISKNMIKVPVQRKSL